MFLQANTLIEDAFGKRAIDVCIDEGIADLIGVKMPNDKQLDLFKVMKTENESER